MTGPALAIPQGRPEARFRPRNRKLDEQARAGSLNSRRLRGVITIWQRHVSTAVEPNDPVLGPWHAFAALPQVQFAAKAAELHRKLTGPKDPKAAPIHPLVAKVVLGQSAARA